MSAANLSHTQVLIIGAGPAGLSAAISLKKSMPELEVCVIDKGASPGAHNLSGAVVESASLEAILDLAKPDWRQSDKAKQILSEKVVTDDIIFAPNSKYFIKMNPFIKAAALCKLGIGKMLHSGDYIVSISRLCAWLAELASSLGVEVLTGFTAEELVTQPAGHSIVKLKAQGLTKASESVPGEMIHADVVLLAEGADGLVTEKFIKNSGIIRRRKQLWSLGVKEVIHVTPDQYKAFGPGRVIHAMGYPLWTPLIGPAMFGGSIMYAYGPDHIALGVIVGLDFKYADFNPQDALELFKRHQKVLPYIHGAKTISAGAKMIPEAGYVAIPRDPATSAIGKGSVIILGDSAGLVNMQQIKGLHNAIDSGIIAAQAVAKNLSSTSNIACAYTELFENSRMAKELRAARNFRQTIAKFGPSIGFPLSVISSLLPRFDIEEDYQAMHSRKYRFKSARDFDKAQFTALAHTHHREDQPCHLIIKDPLLCRECKNKFNQPCITFCPAGVYESIEGLAQPANPSNCLHCKTCQRKCPYDNIRWTAPEPPGGPNYKNM